MMLAEVAYTFSFQPTELNSFTMAKLGLWHERAKVLNKRVYGA